nr:class I SAM-dependent methyltransferase [Micrococcus sp. JXJ CY 30]
MKAQYTHGRPVDESGVREMFTRVAKRYDVGNALMTLGMSGRWRREIQRRARVMPGNVVLDLATGTGQLAVDALRAQPSAQVIGADLTPAMLDIAKQRHPGSSIAWVCLDAHALPFDDSTVDVITHGYLLRYLDLHAGLAEQFRVLTPGGRLVALDTSPGAAGIIGRIASSATTFWPRLVGRFIGQTAEDYQFLQDSSLAFHSPAVIARALEEVGFEGCGSKSYLGGMLAVCWGQKPTL